MTKVRETLTNAHEQICKKGYTIGISLIQKIPTTRETTLFGKIGQERRFPISCWSMKQHKFIGERLSFSLCDKSIHVMNQRLTMQVNSRQCWTTHLSIRAKVIQGLQPFQIACQQNFENSNISNKKRKGKN